MNFASELRIAIVLLFDARIARARAEAALLNAQAAKAYQEAALLKRVQYAPEDQSERYH